MFYLKPLFIGIRKKGSSTAQLGRLRKVLNDKQEEDLRSYLYDMDSVFYGLTQEELKKKKLLNTQNAIMSLVRLVRTKINKLVMIG